MYILFSIRKNFEYNIKIFRSCIKSISKIRIGKEMLMAERNCLQESGY